MHARPAGMGGIQDFPHYFEQDERLAFKDRGTPNFLCEEREFWTG
jgi:hypothetical protein